MKVLVACEFSGVVRDAFLARGHDAMSCDWLPTESPGPHIIGDVRDHMTGWDMMLAFPPCTHLAVSGARWFKEKREDQALALSFVRTLLGAPIPYIAVAEKSATADADEHRPWQRGAGASLPAGTGQVERA